MPPLSQSLHEELGKRLRQRREELVETVRARTDAPEGEAPAISPIPHRGQPEDGQVAEMVSHNEQHFADHETALLHQIDEAIGRLESGGAGICVVCGCEISEERLLATPWVQTCIVCQQRIEDEHERTHRDGAPPTM